MSLRLEDIDLIKRVKYSYVRALDAGAIDALAELFTADAEIDYRGGTYRFTVKGRDEIVAAMCGAFHAGLVGSHTVHMPLIDVHDDDQWTLLDYALNLAEDNKTMIGASHYVDRYVREDGQWRIARSGNWPGVRAGVFHDPAPGLTAHLLGRTLAPQ